MEQVIHFILMPIFWIPVVAILAFLTYRNYKKLNQLKVLNVDSVLLMLEIPRANDKKELAAEQLFASLHGILRDKRELKNSGGVQEHLSFEIVSTAGQIRFYVWVPKVLQSFVEGQIYSQYPTVQIYKMNEDYVDDRTKYPVNYSAELGLVENEALPIKTFDNFEVDPLAGITGTLAKLDPDHSEEMWIQILARPIPDDWHKNTTDKWVKRVKSGKKVFLGDFGIDWTWISEVALALFRPPAGGTGSETTIELSERDKNRIAKAEEKATKLGYEVKIRLAYLGQDQVDAKLNMQALVGTFKQYNSTNLNGFKQIGGSFNPSDLDAYKMRQFSNRGFILNISELASVYHLPHTSVETPNIVWASSKTAEPPAKLPVLTGDPVHDEQISAFGLTNFRGINHQFGLLRRDRSRHMYIIGQTGAGKSGMLELLALSDVFYNQGYCIIDPHGDFAIDNLRFVPESRIKDVVYFNPADTAFPVAFNPLEVSDPSRKPNICSEVIGVLKRMFGDSWGPRLEHILRYTLLALLDRPETTLLDISRLLTDKDFRKETLEYCKDVTVLQFWKHEFGQWNDKQVNESIAPVLNKVGAFTANPIIRNIIGQPKSSFDIRKIMDEGKILVVNLSKGLIGEDNAGILGSFLVTKVQLAAMSRSDIPLIEDRRPFYLYVDEFQNFATDSFSVILSEARKYGLNLTVANQYVAQMTDTVRDAVFGNVGTTISFRVSADDAPILVKQFEPTFEESDIIQLNNRNFVISMIINGEKVPAFSATTLSIPDTPKDNFDAIVAHSREYYARPRLEVEAEIRETIEQSEKYKKELSDSGRQEEPKMVINTNSKPVFRPVSTPSNSASQRPARPFTKSVANAEQKPNLRYQPTPQADFRRQNISPNAAEGKERMGLKDLAKLIAEGKENTETTEKEITKEPVRIEKEQPKKGKAQKNRNRKKGNKKSEKDPQKKTRGDKILTATSNDKSAPVKPEVEYQEKSVIEIRPSHNSLPLSTPVKNTDNYASKDNSVDGILSIKH
ncbi:MAG: type IV secretion system DNA-binding domain-containing protein [Candidatus Saccharimonadaceae bacterium]|nr:type IV secretion system DNA-binding domain-containing protein [Candidatus Saccharimonadaceae bacterium]